jgi:hypothetical protein
MSEEFSQSKVGSLDLINQVAELSENCAIAGKGNLREFEGWLTTRLEPPKATALISFLLELQIAELVACGWTVEAASDWVYMRKRQ